MNPQIKQLTEELQRQGLTVYIAKSGDYGFFTLDGSRFISFQTEFSSIEFTGNYKTKKPSQCGSGWRIDSRFVDFSRYSNLLKIYPPEWAVKNNFIRFTTVKEHLNTYDKSSNYTIQGG